MNTVPLQQKCKASVVSVSCRSSDGQTLIGVIVELTVDGNKRRMLLEQVLLPLKGTPLITSNHDQTTIQHFGGYIDTYKLKDAQDDGAVLPIIYTGRTTDTALSHKSEFDEKFEDLFADRTEEELEAIKEKYGTREDILEAEARITEVAKNLVKHYVENVMPDGFKAQVVSVSKVATLS